MRVNYQDNPAFGMKFVVNKKSIEALGKRQSPTANNVVANLKTALGHVTEKLNKMYPEYGDRLVLSGVSTSKNGCEFFNLKASLKLTPKELRERKFLVKEQSKKDTQGRFYHDLPHVWLKYGKEIAPVEQIEEKILKRASHLDIDPTSDKCIDFFY